MLWQRAREVMRATTFGIAYFHLYVLVPTVSVHVGACKLMLSRCTTTYTRAVGFCPGLVGKRLSNLIHDAETTRDASSLRWTVR